MSEGSYRFLLPLSAALFSSVNLISLWAMNAPCWGCPGVACWGGVGCWEGLPPAEDFAGLGGCVDDPLFRLSSFTPSSFLDFPANKKCSVTATAQHSKLPWPPGEGTRDWPGSMQGERPGTFRARLTTCLRAPTWLHTQPALRPQRPGHRSPCTFLLLGLGWGGGPRAG